MQSTFELIANEEELSKEFNSFKLKMNTIGETSQDINSNT